MTKRSPLFFSLISVAVAVLALATGAMPGQGGATAFAVAVVSGEVVLAASLALLGLAAFAGIVIASQSLRRERLPHLGLAGAGHSAAHAVARPRRGKPASPRASAPAGQIRPSDARVAPCPGVVLANVPDAVPGVVPETVEERAALIARLVAARPCRANPFVSRKARARRARIIVRSLTRRYPGRTLRLNPPHSDRQPQKRGWNPATA